MHKHIIWGWYSNAAELNRFLNMTKNSTFFGSYLREDRLDKLSNILSTGVPKSEPNDLHTLLFSWHSQLVDHLTHNDETTIQELKHNPEVNSILLECKFPSETHCIAWILCFAILKILWGNFDDRKIKYMIVGDQLHT